MYHLYGGLPLVTPFLTESSLRFLFHQLSLSYCVLLTVFYFFNIALHCCFPFNLLSIFSIQLLFRTWRLHASTPLMPLLHRIIYSSSFLFYLIQTPHAWVNLYLFPSFILQIRSESAFLCQYFLLVMTYNYSRGKYQDTPPTDPRKLFRILFPYYFGVYCSKGRFLDSFFL